MWPFGIGSRSPTRRRGTLPSRSPLGEHCEAKPSATRAREQRGAGEAGERSEPGSPCERARAFDLAFDFLRAQPGAHRPSGRQIKYQT